MLKYYKVAFFTTITFSALHYEFKEDYNMNIINSIKSFFITTAGTPVAMAKIKSNMLATVPESEKATTKIDYKKIYKCTSLILKYICNFFKSAIIFVVLAHFVPELREQLPDFYQFIDFVMYCFNWMSAQFLSIFG